MSSALKSHRPMDRCFANVIILDKVLHHVSDHPMSILQLRLVNKACNRAILCRIRKSYREIRIRKHSFDCEGKGLNINDHLLKFEKARERFEFLVNVANVQVEKVMLKDLDRFYQSRKQSLHDAIIQVLLKNQTPRVLTGMNEICEEGCSDCIKLALGCQEYGPMQFEVLKAFKNQKVHFRKLKVMEEVLRDITNRCRESTESREQCLEMMRDMINGNLTCDHLQLSLADYPLYSSNIRLRKEQAFPLELLVQMCTAWEVKTIRIHFKHFLAKTCFPNTAEKKFFTEFQFDNPFEQTPKSTGFLLDHVEVDLERAPYSDCGVFGENMPLINNLLPNIRRLFPAKHYYMNNYKFHEWNGYYPKNDYTISSNKVLKIINAAFKGTNSNACNAPVTCRYYTQIKDTSMGCDIPETIWTSNRLFKTDVLPLMITDWFVISEDWQKKPTTYDRYERVAKTFRITDSASGCVLDLEIYVEKDQLIGYVGAHGFLRSYRAQEDLVSLDRIVADKPRWFGPGPVPYWI